jgi:hypothetical protein
MALHRRLTRSAASAALPAVAAVSLLSVAVLSAAPVHAQSPEGAAVLRVLSPRSGDAVGSTSFSLDVSFHARSESAPITTAELWVDGVRWVRQDLQTPQVSNLLKFDVDASSLPAGVHAVVVRVFAADGAVSEAKVDVEAGNDQGISTGAFSGPAMSFLTPGNGKHVTGTVELTVDAQGRNGLNPYVTFYVDKQFKTLKNYPPYTLDWDTTQVSNGFHTVEATGYVDSSDVSTTCRLRVYVDNPGGNTMRMAQIPDLRRHVVSAKTAPISAASAASGLPAPHFLRPTGDAVAVLPAPHLSMVASRASLRRVAVAERTASAADDTVRLVEPSMSIDANPESGRVDSFSPAKTRLAVVAPASHSLSALIAPSGSTALMDTGAAAISPATPSMAVQAVAVHEYDAQVDAPTVTTQAAPGVNGLVAVRRSRAAALSTATYSLSPLHAVAALHARAVAISHSGSVLQVGATEQGASLHVRDLTRMAITANLAPAHSVISGNAAAPVRISAAAPHASTRPYVEPIVRTHALQIAFDGSQIAFDVQPRVEAGLPVAPFRQIFEHTGGEVDWIASTQVVRAVNSDREVVIRVGKDIATVNGQDIKMDRAAFVERGRTIVPLSFVGKALDVDVKYDPATGHLEINSR